MFSNRKCAYVCRLQTLRSPFRRKPFVFAAPSDNMPPHIEIPRKSGAAPRLAKCFSSDFAARFRSSKLSNRKQSPVTSCNNRFTRVSAHWSLFTSFVCHFYLQKTVSILECRRLLTQISLGTISAASKFWLE